MSAVTLTLPMPPSSNKAYRSVTIKGRAQVLLSKEGRQYKATVRGYALENRVRCFPAHARLGVALSLFFGRAGKADCDNRQKLALDSLKGGVVMVDDDQVDLIVTGRGGVDRENPRVEVRVWILSPDERAALPHLADEPLPILRAA